MDGRIRGLRACSGQTLVSGRRWSTRGFGQPGICHHARPASRLSAITSAAPFTRDVRGHRAGCKRAGRATVVFLEQISLRAALTAMLHVDSLRSSFAADAARTARDSLFITLYLCLLLHHPFYVGIPLFRVNAILELEAERANVVNALKLADTARLCLQSNLNPHFLFNAERHCHPGTGARLRDRGVHDRCPEHVLRSTLERLDTPEFASPRKSSSSSSTCAFSITALVRVFTPWSRPGGRRSAPSSRRSSFNRWLKMRYATVCCPASRAARYGCRCARNCGLGRVGGGRWPPT